MRRRLEVFLIISVVALILAITRPEPWAEKPVTLHLNEVTLEQTLQEIARQQGLQLLPPPRADELVTVDSDGVSLDEAIYRSTGLQCKVLDGLLLTYSAVREFPGCGGVRIELLLEKAPVELILPRLRFSFPEVQFIPHPTMPGFYARGSRDDLLAIKRSLGELDLDSSSPQPDLAYTHKLQQLNFAEASSLISGYPGLDLQQAGADIALSGQAIDVIPAAKILQKEDRIERKVVISKSELMSSKPACALESQGALWTINCKTNCHCPLPLLGLQTGDKLLRDHLSLLRTQPEWWVTRQDKELRIINHFR